MQRKEIENIANRVLAIYNPDIPPVQLIECICKNEGIILERIEFEPEIDGMFVDTGEEKFIYYNPDKVEGRISFTQAHELGHYFLKHELTDGNSIRCSENEISEENEQSLPRHETEANYFAAYFLMPEKPLMAVYRSVATKRNINLNRPMYVDNQKWNLTDWYAVSGVLKKLFGVSEQALIYRMTNLGLLDYRVEEYSHLVHISKPLKKVLDEAIENSKKFHENDDSSEDDTMNV